ncbi:MAG: hypothetical protein ABIJ27_05940 [Candidatus Omnitrophota bacterium]
MRLFIVVFFICTAASVGRCSSSEAGAAVDGIQISISSNKDRYMIEDDFVVDIEIKNVSGREINFFYKTCPVEFLKMYVYSSEGRQLYKTEAMHLMPCQPSTAEFVKLKPGESRKETQDISQIIRKIVPENGIYTVQYSYSVPQHWTDLKDVDKDYWKRTVLSKALPIEVIKSYTIEEVAGRDDKKLITDGIKEIFVNEKVDIEKIEEIKDLKIPGGIRLLRIYVSQHELLEFPVLPDGPSFGMFALYDGKLIYLNGKNTNLDRILWKESAGSMRELDPKSLALMVILCKVSGGETRDQLITSAQDVYKFETKKDPPVGYVVHRKKLNKFKGVIKPPQWEDTGFTDALEFYVLSGWMHDLTNLAKVRVDFDKSSPKISVKREYLEGGIFKSIPDVSYR